MGVYPRVCGGTRGLASYLYWPVGLSPRVRGNPRAPPRTVSSPRSIPACAGEPGRPDDDAGLMEVYPRVCGGTILDLAEREQLPGLSPRVRGNQDLRQHVLYLTRSIPACAGEPPLRRHDA